MNIKQLMQTVQMSQNPQMMLQHLMSTNPSLKQAVEYINANGGDPKEAFYKLAQEKGIDPQTVLNSLK